MKANSVLRAKRSHLRAVFSISSGFTLVELLVVVAVMGVLAAVLLPALANGNQQGEGVQCLNNLQRLSQAWLMYNADNQGRFTPNAGEQWQPSSPSDPKAKPGGSLAQWCPGQQQTVGRQLSPIGLSPSAPNLGLQWIQSGLIFAYVGSTQPYLCPADESFDLQGGQIYPHVRSESMNAWLNPLGGATFGGGVGLRTFMKELDLTVPGPANTWLLMDENPQSINDGFMVEDPSQNPPAWVDCPGSFHNGACGISFCDGHAGLKKWKDPVVLSVTSMNDVQNWNGGSPRYLPDVLWIENRSTALQTTTSFLGPQGW